MITGCMGLSSFFLDPQFHLKITICSRKFILAKILFQPIRESLCLHFAQFFSLKKVFLLFLLLWQVFLFLYELFFTRQKLNMSS